MTDAFADLVMPIFRRVIELRNQLDDGDDPRSFDEVMSLTQSWLDEAGRRAASDPQLAGSFENARHGLVSWIDETLTDSDWGRSVGWGDEEHALEWFVFGRRDREWLFYRHAEEAEAQSDLDALEAYLLCVVLGFQGELKRAPDAMVEWVQRVYRRIGETGGVASKPFPDADNPEASSTIGPLRGPALLLRASALCALTALATVLLYIFAVHHDYHSAG